MYANIYYNIKYVISLRVGVHAGRSCLCVCRDDWGFCTRDGMGQSKRCICLIRPLSEIFLVNLPLFVIYNSLPITSIIIVI